MPELCRFYGIVIRMYFDEHPPPHFHAVYQEYEAVFTITPVELLSGSMPNKQQRLVVAWAEIHQDDLLSAWTSLDSGQKPSSIEPLR